MKNLESTSHPHSDPASSFSHPPSVPEPFHLNTDPNPNPNPNPNSNLNPSPNTDENPDLGPPYLTGVAKPKVLLQEWLTDCSSQAVLYSHAAALTGWFHTLCNVIGILLNSVSTFATFAQLSSGCGDSLDPVLIAVGILIAAGTSLMSLAYFFNWNDQAKKHETTQVRYQNLARTIQAYLTLGEQQKERSVSAFLAETLKEFQTISKQAAPVPWTLRKSLTQQVKELVAKQMQQYTVKHPTDSVILRVSPSDPSSQPFQDPALRWQLDRASSEFIEAAPVHESKEAVAVAAISTTENY